MQKTKLLEKLTEFEATGAPFISVYLTTEANENGKTAYQTFIRKQVSENSANYEIDSPEKADFDQTAERITAFLETVRPTTQGVAIFASTEPDGLFETREFDVPFQENSFYVFDKPYLFPLVRLIEQNPVYAVALADTNTARIYVFGRGQVINKEEIENTKTSRSQVGGWSQQRYQRHNENFHQQHAKETIEELAKIVRDEHIKSVVLAGDETVIIPLLKAELTKELEPKIIGTLRLNVNTSEDELFEQAKIAIKQHDTLQDKEKIDHLFEQNYDQGLGVLGVERTLAALSNGQVQELYLSDDFNNIKYNMKKVEKVLEDYAPGEDSEELPDARQTGMLVDELIRKALYSADNIRFIEDENLLKKAGGIGALLRYRMETSAATGTNG